MLIAKPVRQIFGGKLRCGFYAGAKLPPEIFRTLIGLGIAIMTCYGQTEAGPVISANRPDDNIPASVGKPLAGVNVRVEYKTSPLPPFKGGCGELIAKGPGVMTGYWNNPAATQAAIDKEGWLHTGDRCYIDAEGRIFFMGRMSDTILMQNGEEISPAEIESEISAEILFDQAMVIGKGRPFLTALLVLNTEHWKKLAKQLKLNPDDPSALKDKSAEKAVLARITKILGNYSDAVQIRRVKLLTEPWTVQDGLVTPSAKLKRANLSIKYAEEIDKMYAEEQIANPSLIWEES
jgi:long-chain acyl-CoA synthetase